MKINKKISLNESVNKNELMDAIKNKSVVTIYYDGDHIINKGYRDIEPFCYGRSRWGHDSLRAWQTEGVSDTPEGRPDDELSRIPGWRMFRIDRIKSFQVSDLVFTIARPKYNPEDKDMTSIYIAADFSGNPVQNVQDNPEVKQPDDKTSNNVVSPQTPSTSNTPEPQQQEPQNNPSRPVSSNSSVKRNFLQRIADRFKNFLSRK